VVGLELRNVVANYPFERSHRFAIKPNSGHRDHSCLSCGVGMRSSSLVPGSQQALLRLRCHRGAVGVILATEADWELNAGSREREGSDTGTIATRRAMSGRVASGLLSGTFRNRG
jgi:hypothetical protein